MRVIFSILIFVLLMMLTALVTVAQGSSATIVRHANVRSGPGTGYKLVGKAKAGDIITVLEVSDDGEWLRIGDSQWVASFRVSVPSPAASTVAVAVTATPTSRPSVSSAPLDGIIGGPCEKASDTDLWRVYEVWCDDDTAQNIWSISYVYKGGNLPLVLGLPDQVKALLPPDYKCEPEGRADVSGNKMTSQLLFGCDSALYRQQFSEQQWIDNFTVPGMFTIIVYFYHTDTGIEDETYVNIGYSTYFVGKDGNMLTTPDYTDADIGMSQPTQAPTLALTEASTRTPTATPIPPAGQKADSDLLCSTYNSAWDGSVFEVDRWLKQKLNDPGSLEYIDWYQLFEIDKGICGVRVEFRAKNGFGSYVMADWVFLIDAQANVLGYEEYANLR
ncbi:MAG: SH3 domain-containing protein [Caldilineaceae bacterium]|nr:SH3 domain-containing protein [Caldilineaceae bacterium]